MSNSLYLPGATDSQTEFEAEWGDDGDLVLTTVKKDAAGCAAYQNAYIDRATARVLRHWLKKTGA